MSARVAALMTRLGDSTVPGTGRDPARTPPAVAVGTRQVSTQAAANDSIQRPALWLQPCGQCAQRRAPGTAWPGYCAGRDDLPLAYGLLHELPADLGDGCPEYRPRG